MVIAGGIGLAAASGKNPHLLEIGLIIFATHWSTGTLRDRDRF
jgi:hypothetical protein